MNVNSIATDDDNDDIPYISNNLTTTNNKNHLVILKQKDKYHHLHLNSINIKNVIDINLIMPPNPLLPRKYIPVNSPKFGNRKDYIKLPKFNHSSLPETFEYKDQENPPNDTRHMKREHNQQDDTSCVISHTYADYTKETSIDSYVNNPKMISKLVYYKNKLSNENKVSLDNLVNLKKQSRQNKQNIIESYYQLTDKDDKTVQFESRFENGNLLAAYHPLENHTYQLLLQKDTNTNGYHQWFFFKVKNTRPGHKVTFSIINLIRPRAKYSKGMKVWCYSEMKNKHEGLGWHHSLENTSYSLNGLYYYRRGTRKNYSTLSFDYTFQYNDDHVYFANCIPYTYTDLMNDLAEYQKVENTKYPFFHRKTLCQTLAGNDFDYITINTSKCDDKEVSTLGFNDNTKDKEAIVFIARQHPSESPSSWVLKGAIEFLLGNSEEATFLRDQFIFKIFPMMNPDGVIEGNTRTSFAGCDLNRRWKNPKEAYHPEIFYTKEMITKISTQRKIQSLIDFHGHFGAFNSFFYCNYDEDIEHNKTMKAFPYITSLGSNMINHKQFTFKMEKSKKTTCRISLFNELHIENILTLETSNFGFAYGEKDTKYINVDLLKDIGRDVCIGLLMYQYYSLNKMNKGLSLQLSDGLISKCQNIIMKMEMLVQDIKADEGDKKAIKKEDDNKEALLKLESFTNTKDEVYCSEDDLESESEPSEDDLPFEEIQKLINIKRKHNHKMKKKNRNKKRLSTVINKANYKQLIITTNNNPNHQNIKSSSNSNPHATDVTFPKLKSTPSNMNQTFKTSMQIKTGFGVNKNKISSFKPIETSSSNKLLIKESILKTTCSSDQLKSLSKKTKIDMETQTEDVYFDKHWSHFSGLYPILSPSKKPKIVNLINKKVNVILDNESMHNFYMHKLFDLQRSKMLNQRTKMMRHNMEQTRRYERNEMRLMFGSLGDGAISVTKNYNIYERKSDSRKRNGSDTVRKERDRIRLCKK